MPAKNNWSEYQRLVLQRLDDLHENQQKTNKFLFDHIESNNKDFEALRAGDAAIRSDMAIAAASAEASAAAKSKFWGSLGAMFGVVGGTVLGIAGDWVLFGRGR